MRSLLLFKLAELPVPTQVAVVICGCLITCVAIYCFFKYLD